MADIQSVIQSLLQLAQQDRAFEDIVNNLKALENLKGTSVNPDNAKKLAEAFGELETKCKSLGKNWEDFAKQAGISLEDLTKDIKTIQREAESLGDKIVRAASQMGAAFESTRKSAVNLFDGLKQGNIHISPMFDDWAKQIFEFDKRFKETAQTTLSSMNAWAGAGAQANNSFNRMASSTGNLSVEFAKLGVVLGVDAAELRKGTQEMSKWYDVSKDKLLGGAAAVKTASGAYGLLETAIRLSRGTGTDLVAVTGALEAQMYTMGLSAQKAAENIAGVAIAADRAGVSNKVLLPYVTQTAETFKYLGTDLFRTTMMYGEFAKIGKDIGLGPGAALDLGKNYADSLLKMNMASKAFVAQVGGLPGAQGRGAVGGGLAVEQAISEGRWGEVTSSIERTLRTTTGAGLMTRQEALTTGKADQFYIQRQLTGQMLGVGDPYQAGRIMEIMRAMKTGGGDTAGLQTELGNILEKRGGADYMQQTVEVSKQIAQKTEEILATVGRDQMPQIINQLQFIQASSTMAANALAKLAGWLTGIPGGLMLGAALIPAVVGGIAKGFEIFAGGNFLSQLLTKLLGGGTAPVLGGFLGGLQQAGVSLKVLAIAAGALTAAVGGLALILGPGFANMMGKRGEEVGKVQAFGEGIFGKRGQGAGDIVGNTLRMAAGGALIGGAAAGIPTAGFGVVPGAIGGALIGGATGFVGSMAARNFMPANDISLTGPADVSTFKLNAADKFIATTGGYAPMGMGGSSSAPTGGPSGSTSSDHIVNLHVNLMDKVEGISAKVAEKVIQLKIDRRQLMAGRHGTALAGTV